MPDRIIPITDLRSRIARDPVFAHGLLFSHTHEHLDAPFHKNVIELLHGPDEQVVFLCFRNGAKSALAEESIAIGALTESHQYFLIVCSTERRACDRLFAIANALEKNEVIEDIYGDVRGETWHSTRLILKNGTCIEAIGAGSNTRGMRYLNTRPQYILLDDIEEMSATSLDNVSTQDKRDELMRWFRSFVPTFAEPYKLRIAGTALHEQSLIMKCVNSDRFKSLVVPIETIDRMTGERIASWPDKFPISWIDRSRSEAASHGQTETWAQEYLCQASSPQTRAFREEMLRFDETPYSGEPCHVIYDPARTNTPGKSCATGKIVASWVANRLHIWEAAQAYWLPDEIIDDVFKSAARWNPISICIEETGLNQFLMQPLRQSQISRGSIPLRPVNPPRGPGKQNFLLGLQPFFAAGEVVFHGPRQKFKALIDELLGFPFGLVDTINALAYMLEIRSGDPVFPNFTRSLVMPDPGGRDPRGRTNILLLNADQRRCISVSAIVRGEAIHIVSDHLEEGAPSVVLPSMIRQARARLGPATLVCYAPPHHWKEYDPIGLPPAATRSGIQLLRGGDRVKGRDELQARMKHGETPSFTISPEARWTVQAFSGGYSYPPDTDRPTDNEYGLIAAAIECLMPVISSGFGSEDVTNRMTPDGRPFLSIMPAFTPRRERERAL